MGVHTIHSQGPPSSSWDKRVHLVAGEDSETCTRSCRRAGEQEGGGAMNTRGGDEPGEGVKGRGGGGRGGMQGEKERVGGMEASAWAGI